MPRFESESDDSEGGWRGAPPGESSSFLLLLLLLLRSEVSGVGAALREGGPSGPEDGLLPSPVTRRGGRVEERGTWRLAIESNKSKSSSPNRMSMERDPEAEDPFLVGLDWDWSLSFFLKASSLTLEARGLDRGWRIRAARAASSSRFLASLSADLRASCLAQAASTASRLWIESDPLDREQERLEMGETRIESMEIWLSVGQGGGVVGDCDRGEGAGDPAGE